MSKIRAIAVLVRVLHEGETKVDYVILGLFLLLFPHLSFLDPQVTVLAVLLQNQVPVVIGKKLPRRKPSRTVDIRRAIRCIAG